MDIRLVRLHGWMMETSHPAMRSLSVVAVCILLHPNHPPSDRVEESMEFKADQFQGIGQSSQCEWFWAPHRKSIASCVRLETIDSTQFDQLLPLDSSLTLNPTIFDDLALVVGLPK